MVEWSKNGGFPFFSLNNIDFFVGKDILIPVGRRERFLKFYQNKAPVVPRKNQFFGLGLRLFRFEKWGNTMVGKLTQRLHKSKNGKKGFTLVELIVVIVIILILAAVMVPLLMNYIGQANDASLKSEAATALTQVQSDFAASQATKQTGMARPGATAGADGTGGYTAPAGLTVKEEAAAVTATTADLTGATSKTAVYHAEKNANRGNYEEITSFGYSNGSKIIVWTAGSNDGNGGWSAITTK